MIIRAYLEPIMRGLAFEGGATFTAPPGQTLPFPPLAEATRIRGDFRLKPKSMGGAVVASVDTQDGTLLVNGDYGFTIVLSGEQTALFAANTILFDMLALGEDGEWRRAAPALFHWPVGEPVSEPPAGA